MTDAKSSKERLSPPDLPARLRAWWQADPDTGRPEPELIGPLLDEAADEIERLESCIRGLSSHAMKASAEETRLRAALKLIANPDNRYEGEGECEAIAHEALRGEVERHERLGVTEHVPAVGKTGDRE